MTEQRDTNGLTALMRACSDDDLDRARSLVTAGADINSETPRLAISAAYCDMVATLIAYGPRSTHKTPTGTRR